MESESALTSVLRRQLENALLRALRSGEDEELAIGENAVDIEQKELDCQRPCLDAEGNRQTTIDLCTCVP